MLATLYLVAVTMGGFAVITRLTPNAPTIVRLPGGLLLGIVVTSWTTYVVADSMRSHVGDSLHLGVIVSTVLGLAAFVALGRRLRLRDLRITAVDAVVSVVSLVFSYWLIGQRLQYDPKGDHSLLVSANTWGDFGLHIALSRSFAVGSNYPTEYPFFANEPIRYHFGYDFFAGALQDGGFSVLNSFNIPGVLGFTSMMVLLFAIARQLFGVVAPDGVSVRWWRDRGVWAGFIAIGVLTTNQSLAWLRYVAKDGHGSLWTALKPSVWWHHESYLAIGPYTDDRIAIFNTPNVYLTQTHLIVAMAFVLFLVYTVFDQLKRGSEMNRVVMVVFGIAFGMSFWLNGVLWIASAVFFGMLLFIYAVSALFRARQRGMLGADGAAGSVGPSAGAAPTTGALPGAMAKSESRGAGSKNGNSTRPGAKKSGATKSGATKSGADKSAAGRTAPKKTASKKVGTSPGVVTMAAPPEPALASKSVRDELIGWLIVGACFLIPAVLIGVPQAVWLNGGSTDGGSLTLHIGYLVCSSTKSSCHARGQMNLLSPADWSSFIQYWWLNEGLLIPLVILAFVLGNHRDKKIIAAVTSIFIWGSLFELGRDLGGQNHKTFNLWETLSGLFVGFILVELWVVGARLVRDKFAELRIVSIALKVGVIFSVIFMSASGLIDLMTIKNDYKVSVFGDATEQSAISWIDQHTPKKAVFLTDWDQLYTAPTMAGRDIFLGYSSWASGAGYPVAGREDIIKQIYSATDRQSACALLKSNQIDYVMVAPEERTTHNFQLNSSLFSQFTLTQSVGQGDQSFDFYAVAQSC